MSKKYLDDSGLTYFWGKLKNYFQVKLVSGTNIKTINNTSLLGSGDIDVGKHMTLTQTQYDALTPAQQTDGTIYFISDATVPAIVVADIINVTYPVGSYYETSDANFDPNISWGGTWVLETEGQVHIGAGSNYTLGATGGEATHTLDVTEMPSHTHSLYGGWGAGSLGDGWWRTDGNNPLVQWVDTMPTGGGQAHNNMQPYIVVNRWHRTA